MNRLANGPGSPGRAIPAPRVSVVIRTRDRPLLLAQAVRSVLAQNFTNYEIVIVDDGSKRDARSAIADLLEPRIRIVRHAKSRGPVEAGNTGIAHAAGEYTAFLDDDDEWLAHKLQRQVAVLGASAPDVAWVYAWRDIVDADGRVVRSSRKTMEGDILERLLALDWPGPPSTWLVRTSVLRELGGFRIPPGTDSPRGGDVDLVRRLCLRGHRVRPVREVLVRKRVHAMQITAESAVNLDARAAFFRAHLDGFAAQLAARPAARATVQVRLAWVELRRGGFGVAARLVLSALRRRPLAVLRLAIDNPWFLRTAALRIVSRRLPRRSPHG